MASPRVPLQRDPAGGQARDDFYYNVKTEVMNPQYTAQLQHVVEISGSLQSSQGSEFASKCKEGDAGACHMWGEWNTVRSS